ncbi:phenylalanine 4-monooxygenase [Fulvivirga lutea]|uniref:phenylalanine 4-monooxygenase n=1 Tax=Fulvivirga lutea TaxID=2810512 RepID=A0A974ZZJ4_9BACT|nr:phenylalanine 4-monooxygenase [Fulvivirga lutea]QSE96175.1 phenylalanine 4-monooxygenase [Fulvivirga lutea]
MKATEKRSIPTLKNMQQVYDNYTVEDHKVWKILFDRQIKNLPTAATAEYLAGLDRINFTNDEIPNFEKTNKILREATGWELVAVEGIVDDQLFFELMANKKFPATTWLRKMSELDYLEEPDMFHDVFAHVPLLVNQPFVDFLQALSQIAVEHAGDVKAIDLLSRVYWFTVEFGLIRESSGLRIYGAGILSSAGETKFSLSNEPKHFEYNVDQILNTPYRKDIFQDRYFIIDSFEELFESIHEVRMLLNDRITKKLMFA